MADTTEVGSQEANVIKLPPPPLDPVTADDGEGGPLPDLLVEQYRGQGKEATGETYARHARNFLNWSREKGVPGLRNIPPGWGARYVLENIQNPTTRNQCVAALNAFFAMAEAKGIKFLAQDLTAARTIRTKKPKTPEVPESPVGATMSTATTPPAQPPVAVAPTTPVMQVAPEPPPPPAPVAATPAGPAVIAVPKAQVKHAEASAFPSLGTRVKVCKMLSPLEATRLGIPPGSALPIGVYDKRQIELEGSLDGFIMRYVRPVHGPRPGEDPVTYRVSGLDTSGKDMPGATWDVFMAADIAAPGGSLGPPAPSTAAPLTAPAAAPTHDASSAILADMLKQVTVQHQDAQRRYEDLLVRLADQKKSGQIDEVTMMLLMERNKPAPFDAEAFLAKAKAELSGLAAPAQPPAPAYGAPPAWFDAQPSAPRVDPAVEALTKTVADLTTRMTELTVKMSQPPPAKDPIEMFGQMMALLKAATPPPPPPPPENPLMAELAKISIRQLTEPPKTKTLQEILADVRAIKELSEGNEPEPSALDRITDMVAVVAENADKIGDALGKVRGAAIQGMIKPTQPQALAGAPAAAPKQLPAKAAPAAPAKPAAKQEQKLPQEGRQAFIAMIKAIDEGKDDPEIFPTVLVLLQTLNGLGGTWKTMSEKLLDMFQKANSKPEIRTLATQLFRWCGAESFLSEIRNGVHVGERRVEKLTSMFHANYTRIHSALFGEEKVLKDAVPEPQPQESSSAEQQPEIDGGEGDEQSGEDEADEEDDASDDATEEAAG